MSAGGITIILTLAFLGGIGFNIVFWTIIGGLRLACGFGDRLKRKAAVSPRFLTTDVAIVIPAYNEERAISSCLNAALRLVSSQQIFIGNDCSSDRTASIVESKGCNVYSAEKNVGKARILATTISHFGLCEKYGVILILDADSELDCNYLKWGLPLFDRPKVAVVAGHVISRSPFGGSLVARLINSYRSRLYATVQALVKYGQTFRFANVTYIAPGFASMYRADALKQVDIVASGLVIEDFNMTFEVHSKELGEVAYSPWVRCSTEDPATLTDYSHQVSRWYLGFWQTLRKQRFWFGKFWLALFMVVFESMFASVFVLALPVLLMWSFADGSFNFPLEAVQSRTAAFSPELGITVFLAADLLLTCLGAAILRRPTLILYAPILPFIRAIDAYWFLAAIWGAFTIRSDGRWKSPPRALRHLQA